jgi:hypothetical protein
MKKQGDMTPPKASNSSINEPEDTEMAKMQGKENDPWTSKSVQTNS